MQIPVTNIQRFCMHDGPGVRTVVFLAGCPLSCRWCHNPETQSREAQLLYYEKKCIGCGECAEVCPNHAHIFEAAQTEGLASTTDYAQNDEAAPIHNISAVVHTIDRARCKSCFACVDACPTGALEPSYRLMSISEIADLVERDRAFMGTKGGITLSGGEPMYSPDCALELLAECRRRGIGTAVETCGCFDPKYIPRLVELCGLLLWDYKDSDDARHRANTGAALKPIVDNLLAVDSLGAPTQLRCIIIKGVNLDERHLDNIASLYHRLKHCGGVKLLPYHSWGNSKLSALGRNVRDSGCQSPTRDELQSAGEYLRSRGVHLL